MNMAIPHKTGVCGVINFGGSKTFIKTNGFLSQIQVIIKIGVMAGSTPTSSLKFKLIKAYMIMSATRILSINLTE